MSGRDAVERYLPVERLRPVVRRARRLRRPAVLGTLRRRTPLSDHWGFERGLPIDRWYIERFLEAHRADIHGRVLEVRDSTYTERFGTGVERAEIIDIDAENPRATVVADLACADHVPADSFDCFVLTQTLQLVYPVATAIAHAHRILRPGGVLLATVPSVSKLAGSGGFVTDYWRFTEASCTALFGEVFGPEAVTVAAHGNVLASIGFLAGMAAEELRARDLAFDDPRFPLVVTVRAEKRSDAT